MILDPENKNHETTCKLEDGTVRLYDAAHNTGEQVYDPKVFEFIGTGRIHSVRGILCEQTSKLYFYRKIKG